MIRRLVRRIIIWAMDWDQVDLICQEQIRNSDPAKALERMRQHNRRTGIDRGIFTEPADDFECVKIDAGKPWQSFMSWRKRG